MEVKKRGAKLYVAILPVFFDLRDCSFCSIYAEIKRRLEEKSVKTIDLTKGLETYEDLALWITPFDQHPNELGHRNFFETLKTGLEPRKSDQSP